MNATDPNKKPHSPSPETFVATDIQVQNEAAQVQITWGDGHVSQIPIQRLRGWCPCAECQGHGGLVEWIENDTKGIRGAELVGNYAIAFFFADGHETGIYRWDHLRKLDPAEERRWGEPAQALNQAHRVG